MNPRNERQVKRMLAQLADGDELPEEWQERFRALQVMLRPELAASYHEYESQQVVKFRNKRSSLEDKLAEASRLRENWIGMAACSAKGISSSTFHINFPKGREHTREAVLEIIEEATAPCQTCPVTEECYDYGVQVTGTGTGAGYRVFGGRVLGMNKRLVKLIS